MAVVNQAVEYQKKVSYRLKTGTVVGGLTNQDYKFIGGNEIKIYTRDNMPLNDYQRQGGAFQYGNPAPIGTSLQSFTMDEDKSFTGTIDTMDDAEQMGVLKPGAILAQQTREVIVPYVDAYVLGVMDTACVAADQDSIVTPGATSGTNAWTTFKTLRGYSIDNEGPETGYRAVCTTDYYNALFDSGFVNTGGDMSQKMKQSGFLGKVDGTPIKISPSSRMADNVDLLITHRIATTFANRLKKMYVLNKIWGHDGPGIQGRLVFDAFVDANKVQVMTEHKTQ